MADANTLGVEVLVPDGNVFAGEVRLLSTRTTVGLIGIMANHAPILAVLEPTELRLHKPDGELLRFAQGEGYMEVVDNHALVLIDEATPPEDLDVDRLRADLADADSRIAQAEEGTAEIERARRDKRRAEVFIEVAEGNFILG